MCSSDLVSSSDDEKDEPLSKRAERDRIGRINAINLVSSSDDEEDKPLSERRKRKR